MVLLEENISDAIERTVSDMIQENLNEGNGKKYIAPWFVFCACTGVCALFSGLITTYYGPGASGSGTAEYIGYINGVNYPDFINVATYITKILGTSFAVISKLAVGKEGPLAHIGAISGISIAYLFKTFEFLRNDEMRRVLTAAGCSAGVAVAFGAPIGGTLFAYEMSRPNTFWRFSMIWKVFMACSISCFTLAFL